MDEELIIKAMELSKDKNDSFKYCCAILRNWTKDSIKGITDINNSNNDSLKSTISEEEIRELVDGG